METVVKLTHDEKQAFNVKRVLEALRYELERPQYRCNVEITTTPTTKAED